MTDVPEFLLRLKTASISAELQAHYPELSHWQKLIFALLAWLGIPRFQEFVVPPSGGPLRCSGVRHDR